jgi:hypothetical protein
MHHDLFGAVEHEIDLLAEKEEEARRRKEEESDSEEEEEAKEEERDWTKAPRMDGVPVTFGSSFESPSALMVQYST